MKEYKTRQNETFLAQMFYQCFTAGYFGGKT